jgi:hypothetical protein
MGTDMDKEEDKMHKKTKYYNLRNTSNITGMNRTQILLQVLLTDLLI